ncbi:MAG TPA: FHA domain-containing protein [Thioalkalivibrio sp.]|nr:FHA domain-containing protein [Thioalkalivibrio sp.]
MSKSVSSGSFESGYQETAESDVSRVRALYNPDSRLVLRMGDGEVVMTPAMRVLTMGRNADCDLVVNEPYVSLVHVRILYRKGKFVLIDQSRNGTYVRAENGPEVCLVQDDEFPLAGRGTISLGHAGVEGAADLIAYAFEEK